ncbi:MAG: hypothetical protein AB9866_19090 [Syntrophobacteraceae bacterium]
MNSNELSSCKLTDIEQIYTEEETVYNLEVEEDNSYFANGIAVHNCDILASQDTIGEGPGIYKKAPNRHPRCMCHIYPVFREKRGKAEYPEIGDVKPNTEGLPSSEVKKAAELTP